MKITVELTPKESEDYFYSALCNTLSMGVMAGYGLQLDYKDNAYSNARTKLVETKKDDFCREDVWLQILKDGGTLTLIDKECNGAYTKSITLQDVHEKVNKMPTEHLMNYVNENDDAETGDVLLQTVFYDKIIFG